MTSNQTSVLMATLLRAMRARDEGQSDGQLLHLFLDRRDEAAFAAPVRRHGPMVYGTVI